MAPDNKNKVTQRESKRKVMILHIMWKRYYRNKYGLAILIALTLIFILISKRFFLSWAFNLTWGTLSILSAAGILPLMESWKTKHRKILKNMIPASLIALGGFLSTAGWNGYGAYKQDWQELVSASIELGLNTKYHEYNIASTSRIKPKEFGPLPCYYSLDVSEARKLMSGNSIAIKDKELSLALRNYVDYVEKTNVITQSMNYILSNPLATVNIRENLINEASKNNGIFMICQNYMNNFRGILERKYDHALVQANALLSIQMVGQ